MTEGQKAETQENINFKEWKGFEDFMLTIRTNPREPTYKTAISEALMDESYPPDLLHRSTRGPKGGPPQICGKVVAEYLPKTTGHSTFIVKETSQLKVPLLPQSWEKIKDRFEQVALKDITVFDLLRKLFDFSHSEETVRRLINQIFDPILKENDLICHDNPPIPGDGAAKRKPDYLILDKGEVRGVIEAKGAGCIVKKSITQCMQYLLDLHAKERSTKESPPLFGIVTDALHFIFIKLYSDGQFEFEKDLGQLKVHKANTWDDLKEIAGMINGLCQRRGRYWGFSQTHKISNIGQLCIPVSLQINFLYLHHMMSVNVKSVSRYKRI